MFQNQRNLQKQALLTNPPENDISKLANNSVVRLGKSKKHSIENNDPLTNKSQGPTSKMKLIKQKSNNATPQKKNKSTTCSYMILHSSISKKK